MHLPALSFRGITIAATVILLQACGQEAPTGKPAAIIPFFDLKSFFRQEAEALAGRQPKVYKRLEIDGKTEEQQPQNLNFSEELRLFSDADINRPAWLDKYAVDSLLDNGRLQRLTYRALEEGLKTRELQIDFLNGEVSEIHIRKQFNTAIANTEQKLEYYPGKGYSVYNRQKTVLQAPQVFKVEVSLEF